MRKSSLALLALATIGLAASQASAADLPRKAPAYVPPAPPPYNLDRMLHRRQRRRDIWPPLGGFRFWVSSIPTTILALLVAVKLAAIINSPADGCSASAICLMGQA